MPSSPSQLDMYIHIHTVYLCFSESYTIVQNCAQKSVLTIFCHCCACSRNISHFLPESDTSADVLDELECKSCCFPTNEQEQKYPS